MAQLSKDLRDKIKANPAAPVKLIVRVQGDLDARADELTRLGIPVRRKLRLIQSLAVSGVGTKIVTLTRFEWVTSVEEDKPVKTQKG
ncbi:MAG TPA: hypothetical protein VIX58_05785 [Anaerolineae bacterium]